MDKRKVFPLGGYAPGNYQCKCAICENYFIGDKRAVQCLECAIDMLQSRLSECERERDEYVMEVLKWVCNEYGVNDADSTDGRCWLEAETLMYEFKQSLKSENNGNEGGK